MADTQNPRKSITKKSVTFHTEITIQKYSQTTKISEDFFQVNQELDQAGFISSRKRKHSEISTLTGNDTDVLETEKIPSEKQ